MKDNNIFKSKFFLNLFFIPSITWFVISLLAMIPDETESDSLTWTDLIIVNIVIILMWFIISCIISLVFSIIKNTNNKKQQISKEKFKERHPNLIENNKDKIIVRNNSNQKVKGILIDFLIEFFAGIILMCIFYFGYNVIYHSWFTATMIIIISAPFFWGNFLLSCLGKNSLGQMLVKHKNTNNKKTANVKRKI